MADTLARETLVELARHNEWPSISIFIGTGPRSLDFGASSIRLKNLTRAAEKQLRERGFRAAEIDGILRPATDLVQDASFWRESASDGLGLHLSPSMTRVHRLLIEPTDTVMVSDRFLIRPLLPMVDRGERFVVLALSKNGVRVLEGSRTRIVESNVDGMPKGLADALKYDEFERQVQFRSGTPSTGTGGRRAAIFHGHGGAGDVKQEGVSQYFRMVDQQLKDFLSIDTPPLLLAGVEYLLPIYRSVSVYPNLVDSSLTGNPDNVPAVDLHTEALALLEPYFRAQLTKDLSTLGNLIGTGVASADLDVIVSAAHQGRVKTLFVAPESAAYGAFDPESFRVMVNDGPGPNAQDLMNLAAVETLTHGGVIHAIEPTTSAGAAAIFRY